MQNRTEPRVRIAVEVSLETAHYFYAGISGDMSHGGVFFVTDDPPPPGAEVKVLITVPDCGLVRARGSVRWVRTPDMASPECPPGCGVAWHALDRRSRAAVRRFLNAQPPPSPSDGAGDQRAA